MILHLVRCEMWPMCANEFEFIPNLYPTQPSLLPRPFPENWYAVIRDFEHEANALHFCSKACLGQWCSLNKHEVTS
jgi:hypothetical protein